MGIIDLLTLILDNLGRRKARVALTAIGVIIGSAAVVVLVSLAIGLQRNATQQLYGIGDLTQIQVYPTYGEAGPAMMGGGSGGVPTTTKLITNESLAEFAAIPGVAAVVPRDYIQGAAILKYNRMESYTNIIGAGTQDIGSLGVEAQAGSLTIEKGTAVIGAMVATGFYDPQWRPGQEPPMPPDLLDQQVKLIIIKWDAEGNEVRKTVRARIVGVLVESRGESDWTVYMTLDDVNSYNEVDYGPPDQPQQRRL
jgi:putative ABC transport system permease protein